MQLRYEINIQKFNKIPNFSFSYWINNNLISAFSNTKIEDYAYAGIGMRTGDNEKYLRHWHEVDCSNIIFGCKSAAIQIHSSLRWVPYNKGGEFRRWYGNNDYVVNWFNNGQEIKENTRKNYPDLGNNLGWKISNENYYFKPGITWSGITSAKCSFRQYGVGFIFDSGANGMFPYNEDLTCYINAFLNTSICLYIIDILNPTLNNGAGTIRKIPLIMVEDKKKTVSEISDENTKISKQDWDSFETSWDFKKHPLI